MNDPVLLARLRALWDDLDFVSGKLRSSAWLSEEPSTRAEMLVDSLWSGLEMTLIKEIDRQKRALEKIGRDVTQPSVSDSALTSTHNSLFQGAVESGRCFRAAMEVPP